MNNWCTYTSTLKDSHSYKKMKSGWSILISILLSLRGQIIFFYDKECYAYILLCSVEYWMNLKWAEKLYPVHTINFFIWMGTGTTWELLLPKSVYVSTLDVPIYKAHQKFENSSRFDSFSRNHYRRNLKSSSKKRINFWKKCIRLSLF